MTDLMKELAKRDDICDIIDFRIGDLVKIYKYNGVGVVTEMSVLPWQQMVVYLTIHWLQNGASTIERDWDVNKVKKKIK